MALSRHTSKVYMDCYDVQGTIKGLEKAAQQSGGDAAKYYEGARIALQTILEHEEIRDQSVFVSIFSNIVNEIS